MLNEEYAAKIARDWNVPHSGAGYVTRFQVLRSFLDQYEVHQAGGRPFRRSLAGLDPRTVRDAYAGPARLSQGPASNFPLPMGQLNRVVTRRDAMPVSSLGVHAAWERLDGDWSTCEPDR